MTETLQPPSAGGPPPPQRRIVRRSDEKVLAGVCAAFARATDTDPLLWRVGIAVLSFFGGTGIALYLLGWLLLPKLGAGPTAVERALRRPDKNVGTLVLLGLGAVVLLAVLDNGPGAGALLVLGGIGYLVLRERREGGSPGSGEGSWQGGWQGGTAPVGDAYGPPLVMHGPDPFPAPDPGVGDATSTRVAPEPYDSGLTAPLSPPYGSSYGSTYGTAYGAGYGGGYVGGTYETSPFAAWDAVPPAPKGKRRRSRLGLMTLSAAAVLAGFLLTLRAAGFEQVTAARILASVLVVLGAGMIVGTWVGRARWLVLPSLLVAVALVPAAVVQSTPGYDAGVGSRTWTPGPLDARSQFELGAGDARLDLRELDPAQLAGPLSVDLGVGELVVLVPDDLRVQVSADLGVGEILSREVDGTARTLQEGPADSERDFVVGAAGDPTVVLDLEVGAGVIEVRRVAS